jgi:hypothetical protein
MSLGWRDGLASLFVAAAGVLYAMWQSGTALEGVSTWALGDRLSSYQPRVVTARYESVRHGPGNAKPRNPRGPGRPDVGDVTGR